MLTLLLAILLQDSPKPEWKFSVDENGVHARTTDDAFDLNLGGRYIVVGRWLEDRDEAITGSANGDTFREGGFFSRQARIDFYGTLKKTWEFKVSADLVTSTPTLADGYIGYIGTPWFKVRVGQFKTPQGVEQPGSLLYTTMIDKYPGDTILPGRDVGVKIWGHVVNDIFTYEFMFANGAVTADQNKSVSVNGPTDNQFDFLLQMTMYPGKFIDWDAFKNTSCGYFHQTGLGDDLALADIRLRDTGTRILDFDNNSSFAGAASPAGLVVQDGQRERDGVFFTWAIDNFGIQGEWVRMDITLKNLGGTGGRHTNFIWTWFVDVVWVVTGEPKTFNKRITPESPLHDGGWGAWEIAFRFSQWQVDDSIQQFLEGVPAFPERVTGHTAGINWWPHTNIRVSLNYVYNTFKGRMHLPGGDVSDESCVLFRMQFGF